MRIIPVIAFLISLLIHTLFIYNWQNKKEEKKETIKTTNKKTKIKYVKLKSTTLRKSTKPKVVKKQKIIKKQKAVKKKIQSIMSTKKIKRKKKKIIKPKITKKIEEKLLKEQIVNKKTSIQEKTLEEFLSQKDPVEEKTLGMIEKLYGKEFDKLTKVQKAFIKTHINVFRQITQRVLNRLGYPSLAIQLRISGTNIVEFILYPNGDIKNLRIQNSSGYKVLDDYTLQLIQIAYKDYPKPKTPTKLRFYVNYRLY